MKFEKNTKALRDVILIASFHFSKEKIKYCNAILLKYRNAGELVNILKRVCSLSSNLSMLNVIHDDFDGNDKTLLNWYAKNEFNKQRFRLFELKVGLNENEDEERIERKEGRKKVQWQDGENGRKIHF